MNLRKIIDKELFFIIVLIFIILIFIKNINFFKNLYFLPNTNFDKRQTNDYDKNQPLRSNYKKTRLKNNSNFMKLNTHCRYKVTLF